VRCVVHEGPKLLERWSNNETAVTLLVNDCTHSLGQVRTVDVSYEKQSVTVELDDGAEAGLAWSIPKCSIALTPGRLQNMQISVGGMP